MDKMTSVNKERLIYARNTYSLSIDEVAASTKIKAELLEKVERGDDYLSYSQLERLAEFYKQSLFFFFLCGIPKEDNISFVFRKLKENAGVNLSKKVIDVIEDANIYRQNLEDVYHDSIIVSFTTQISDIDINDQDKISKWVRNKIKLPIDRQKSEFKGSPSDFLEFIRNQLYSLGVYIFKQSFRDDSISGVCVYDEKFPIIVLNNKTSFTRQTFTVFHELYHLIMKQPDVYSSNTIERECDQFAGDFLVPNDDFFDEIKKYHNLEDIDAINKLSRTYNVSRDVILYKLLKRGSITNDFYDSSRENFIRAKNSESSGGNYYYTKISYLGKPYINTVFNQYYSGKITISQVGILTQTRTVNVPKLASSMFGGDY